jgi:hypothetical protein
MAARVFGGGGGGEQLDESMLRRVGSLPALRVVGFQLSSMTEQSDRHGGRGRPSGGGGVTHGCSSPLSTALLSQRSNSGESCQLHQRSDSFSSTATGGAGPLSHGGSYDGMMNTLDSTGSEPGLHANEKSLEGCFDVHVPTASINIPYNKAGNWRR